MADINKVKQGLTCCIIRHPDDVMRCVKCPYRNPNTYCLNRLKMDALEALNELSEPEANCGPDYCEIDRQEESTE